MIRCRQRYEWLLLVAVVAMACGSGTIGDGLPDSGPLPDSSPPPDTSIDCPDPQTYYRDRDGDGYGDALSSVLACEPPAGYVDRAGDCNDGSNAVHPDAVEICGDIVDNDCSGDEPCLRSLLAHWRLDDQQGTTASDASGKGHTGALRGSPTWSNTALGFAGNTADYVEVPHAPAFLLDQGTVAMWFRVSDLSVRRAFFSKDSSGYGTGGHLTFYVTGIAEGNPQRLVVRLQSVSANATLLFGVVETNRWYHVAFTFGPETMKLYIDGAYVGSNAYTGGLGTSSGGTGNFEPIALGVGNMQSNNLSATPASDPHRGDLRDVRIYDRALSATEIAQIYGVTR